jgi:hypothetical protein
MAEVEVDADVFYDLFLSFGFRNQAHPTGRYDKLFLPFRFIYAILVHVFGPLFSSVAPDLPARPGLACVLFPCAILRFRTPSFVMVRLPPTDCFAWLSDIGLCLNGSAFRGVAHSLAQWFEWNGGRHQAASI